MMNQPLVKIGIPCYNRPKGLHDILQWLRVQPYKNIQVYISDNNSTNKEVSFVIKCICKADQRFKYQILPYNVGAHGNFAKVYKFAGSSPYFMYMADDDKYSDNYIENCVDFLENNSKYTLCAGTVFYVDFKPMNIVVANLNMNSRFPILRMIKYLLKSKIGDGLAYGVFRNSPAIWGFETFVAADFVFVARLALAGKVINIADAIMWKSAKGLTSEISHSISHQVSCAWYISKTLPFAWLLFPFFTCKYVLSEFKKRLIG